MIQLGNDLGFTHKTRGKGGIVRERGREDFDRHLASQGELFATIDDSHRATCELFFQKIAAQALTCQFSHATVRRGSSLCPKTGGKQRQPSSSLKRMHARICHSYAERHDVATLLQGASWSQEKDRGVLCQGFPILTKKRDGKERPALRHQRCKEEIWEVLRYLFLMTRFRGLSRIIGIIRVRSL